MVKNPLANAEDIRDTSSIPVWGRCPGGGHGNPFQYSCLENPHGQRSLAATVHRVAKGQTRVATEHRHNYPNYTNIKNINYTI